MVIKEIEIVKAGKDVREWGGGWLVNVEFQDGIRRCFNRNKGRKIANYSQALRAITELVNMQIEWEEDQLRLKKLQKGKLWQIIEKKFQI